jgi:RNA polymerase sigma factor for flagellar operon FliA
MKSATQSAPSASTAKVSPASTETLIAPAVAAPSVGSSAWRAYQSAGGTVDEKELLERYLPLVRNVVDRLKLTLPAHVDADDLYSVGVTGLIAAVRRFNPEQQHTFAAYASTRVRGAVLDELRRLDWFPRRARAKARKIKTAIAELEQRLGRAPDEEEIRTLLGLSLKEYNHWMVEVRPISFVAIDDNGETDEGGGTSRHEMIADEQAVPVQLSMENEEMGQLVAQKLQELPDIQRRVLAMYYTENMRLGEIAAVFNLTESRICQIHARALLGLRSQLEAARNR